MVGKYKQQENRRFYSVLKAHMVRDLMRDIATHPTAFSRGEHVFFDGSGGLYRLADSGTQFPTMRTPSDIDIGVCVPEGLRDVELYKPLQKTLDASFQRLGWESERVSIGEEYQYGVCKVFSPQELQEKFSDSQTIPTHLLEEPMEVWLPIQLMPFSKAYLSPRAIGDEASPSYILQPEEMLGLKLGLLFLKDDFKVTHLQDIYNILNAEPAIIKIDPEGPCQHRDITRLMTLLVLAHSGAVEEDFNIEHLKPTEENVERIYQMYVEREAHRGVQLKKAFVKQQLETIHGLLSCLFDCDEHGQCQLHQEEQSFLNGLASQHSILIDDAFQLDGLKERYAKVFETHPELEANIKSNQFLRDRVRGHADSQLGMVV